VLLEDVVQGERRVTGEPLNSGPELAEVASADRLAGAGKQLEIQRVVQLG
jgi:hypothetical protein